MKKLLILMLIFALACTSMGCRSIPEPDELMLDGILAVSQEKLDKELLGKTRQQILDRWGPPSGSITDGYGDIFLIPYSDQAIVVRYDAQHLVTDIQFIQRNK